MRIWFVVYMIRKICRIFWNCRVHSTCTVFVSVNPIRNFFQSIKISWSICNYFRNFIRYSFLYRASSCPVQSSNSRFITIYCLLQSVNCSTCNVFCRIFCNCAFSCNISNIIQSHCSFHCGKSYNITFCSIYRFCDFFVCGIIIDRCNSTTFYAVNWGRKIVFCCCCSCCFIFD